MTHISIFQTFLYIINSKPNDSSSVLLQKYFWNFQLLQNLIATLFINGFLCIILLIFRKYGKILIWCIHTILMMILLLNIVLMVFLMLKDTIFYQFFLWLPFLLFTVIIIVYGFLVYKNQGHGTPYTLCFFTKLFVHFTPLHRKSPILVSHLITIVHYALFD